MQVNWIIQSYTKEDSYIEFADSVRKQNYSLLEIKDYSKNILNKFKQGKHCVIFNGTIELSKIIKEELKDNCFPVIYCSFNNYLCSRYYSYFGKFLFNDEYILLSLSELKRCKFSIWGKYGKEALIFIRPDSGDKPFQAQILDLIDFDRFFEHNKHLQHELVLVSTPKNIIWEGRIIVSKERNIIAYSTYKFQDQITRIPTVPKESLDFTYQLLSVDYYPDSVFCYDLCQCSDGKFWLLELTSFSSAGLYASNKDDIVNEVSKLAWKDFSLN